MSRYALIAVGRTDRVIEVREQKGGVPCFLPDYGPVYPQPSSFVLLLSSPINKYIRNHPKYGIGVYVVTYSTLYHTIRKWLSKYHS